MGRADHIYVKRRGYTHHGIDCGDGTVIHYMGEALQKSNAAVQRTPLAEFSKHGTVLAVVYADCEPPDAVMERAEGRLGEATYSLFFNNCEHFARWCKTGEHKSDQTRRASSTAGGTALGGTAVAGGIGAVSAAGAVTGLSGSGVMSGLATVGGLVGGGAVAGIVTVGATPAALVTVAMQRALRDDPKLEASERRARQTGRWASVVGAGTGTAGAIAAVAGTGTATGLSGAGIASGLATVGSLVGGGMVAGVAVAAAAPAAMATAAGYGAYRLVKRLRRKKGSD